MLITDIADKGQALGKSGEKVVFVDRAIPGDVVDAWLVKNRKNYSEARVKEVKKKSESRRDPFCSHFGICGGCKWQDMDYPTQLFYKEKQVRDAMKRIAKVENLIVSPILSAPETRYYRNKLEFTFSDRRWLTSEELADKSIVPGNGLGFHIPGRFDKILDIEHCFLQADPSNEIRLALKKYTSEKGYEYFDPVLQKGFLRNVIIRTSQTGDVMVVVIFHHRNEEAIQDIMSFIRDRFRSVTALLYVINGKMNDTVADLTVQLFYGKNHILEKMENLSFKVGAKSFYQTNSVQAEKLYGIARDFAALEGNERVYDLYTGTGTIACFVAKFAKQVVGVEYIEEAIEDAKENARENGITNCSFFAGDMKDVLTDTFFNKHGKPDVIIADPPRAGMQEPVIKSLLHSGAARIVYVSCNPSTQARDMFLLSSAYRAVSCQPVDMFPHTHHVENVVLLQKI